MPLLPLGAALLGVARMSDELGERSDTRDKPQSLVMDDDATPGAEPPENVLHFNPWRDFNDAPAQVDVFGDEPDPAQIAQFMEVVFSYCDDLIPVRSFIDKGQGCDGRPHSVCVQAPDALAHAMEAVSRSCDALMPVRSLIDKVHGSDGRPHNIWIQADAAAAEKMATFATWAGREGAAAYVIPGTVESRGQAKAADIL